MSISVISYSKIDSTNEEAKRVLASSKQMLPFAIATNEQTAGRGTSDRKWESMPGENITISYCFQYEQIVNQMFPLSIVVAFSLTELLDNFDIKSKIKYPNDVYINEKKIAGILIEIGQWSHSKRHVIIGVGLNVNQRNFQIANNKATSMGLITNKYYSLVDIIPLLSDKLEKNLLNISFPNNSAINERFLWLDSMVICYDVYGNEILKGVFKGISKNETICVETQEGLQFASVAIVKTMIYAE